MSEQQAKKGFDRVEMKRRIQERIYAQTRGMNPDQLLDWFHRRVASSRYAVLFREQPPRPPALSARE